MKKITFEFCSDTLKIIDSLKSFYSLASDADVIKKGIALLQVISDLTKEGELIYKLNDKESKIVVHPNSQNKVALKIVQ